ncbi:hypothetical protein [Gimesia chilikensis]|uniref:hypothetical protein n=1 Tax=Gimesia chilikensis TaxID=2605989 RepID=UPI0011894EE8|nr:hypothetical protein [Gimesia chilikensis]QDT82577.1 hypothetical protein MalM14_02060 [Gimesia chilikensis]
MIPKSELIFVYEGYWGDKIFVFSNSEEKAIKAVKRCHAYGEPEEGYEYRLGAHWAIDDEAEGWHIVPREVEIQHIEGKVYGSFANDLPVHLYWECPLCHSKTGEDISADITFPHLVWCEHYTNPSLDDSYLLVHLSEEDGEKLKGT